MSGLERRRQRCRPGPRRTRGRGARERGVGLVEVLVAVLVLSIGFLAAGGMQVQAMRNNQEAYHDSQAQLLLADMVDRMRANPVGVRDGDYTVSSTIGIPVDTAACRAIVCAPGALAARDLSVWTANLDPRVADVAPLLPPSGAGAPAYGSITPGADGVFTLALTWQALVDGALIDRTASTSFVP